jgi:hypothetical protein
MTDLEAAIGTHVQVELFNQAGKREPLAFDVVEDAQADFERGFLGANTPLARAIMGQRAGATIPYTMGDIARVHIVSIAPSSNAPPEDAAQKREQVIRQVIDKSDLANAISYALSFDSKWGDYDPEALARNWTESDEKKDSDEE